MKQSPALREFVAYARRCGLKLTPAEKDAAEAVLTALLKLPAKGGKTILLMLLQQFDGSGALDVGHA